MGFAGGQLESDGLSRLFYQNCGKGVYINNKQIQCFDKKGMFPLCSKDPHTLSSIRSRVEKGIGALIAINSFPLKAGRWPTVSIERVNDSMYSFIVIGQQSPYIFKQQLLFFMEPLTLTCFTKVKAYTSTLSMVGLCVSTCHAIFIIKKIVFGGLEY